jgi:glycosyltransferase involved in cell wall biosynthesis
LLVVSHGDFYRADGVYYMKEVWWSYLHERLLFLAQSTCVVARATSSDEGRFQQARIDSSVRIAELRGRLRAAGTLLRSVWAADFVWIFLPSMRGLAVGLVCGVLRRPYVVYVGSEISTLGPRRFSSLMEALLVRVIGWAGGAIAAGGALAEYTSRYQRNTEAAVPAIGITTVAMDEDAARRQTPYGPIRNWLYVGNLTDRKRPDVILRAFASWRHDCGGQGSLCIVGADPTQDLERLADELHIADSVRWRGYVRNGEELREIYHACDVFILASESEGFPRVLYEAIAHGLPVVTTPVGGISYLLEDEQDCLMVPVGDARAIADAVVRLERESGLRERMVTTARAKIRPIVAADGVEQVRRVVSTALTGRG